MKKSRYSLVKKEMGNYKDFLIGKDKTIRQGMAQLDATSMKILFVVDENLLLLGSISDGDIRRWILTGESIDAAIVNAMNNSPKSLHYEQRHHAKELCRNYYISSIPIIDNENRVIDIFFDAVMEYAKNETKEISAPVVIMAGGKGERLLPYTSIVPKPLIPIGDKPISELVIESFKKFGCKDFYFSLNYKKNMIKAYYDELDKDYSISYVEEDEPLGTGGSLYYLKDVLKETFFVSNCDILLDADYSDVLKFHKKHKNIITVVTSLKKYTIPYGTVKLDDDGRIAKLMEKPSTDYLVNTGVYILEPEIMDYFREKKKLHLTDLVEKCLKDGKNVGTFPISEDAWMDMGQFEDMSRMKEKLNL